MKKSPILISLISILAISSGVALGISRNNKVETVQAVGNYSTNASTYYNGITATSGTALLGQLHDLMVNTHQTYTTYDDCKTPEYVYAMEPGTSSNYVTDFYTQQNIAKAWGSGATGTWNREHVWCQSQSDDVAGSKELWGTSYGGSDLHHLRPIESTLNSTRNNHPFGLLSDFGLNRDSYKSYSKDSNKNELYHGGYTSNDADVYEPLDSVKGDVARILMYVFTHYSSYSYVGGTTDGALTKGTSSGKLAITNIVTTSAGTEAAAWALLLNWNSSDPVSSAEQVRNNQAAIYQGNRNPFIDNSGYANAIWGSGSSTPTVNSVTVSPSTLSLNLTNNTTGTLTANVSVSGGAAQTVNWSSNKTSVATVSNGVVTAKGEGTATITATSTVDSSKKGTCTVTVTSTGSGGQTADPETFTMSEQGITSGNVITTLNGDNCTITFDKGTNTNEPKYYSSGTAVRAYGGNTITIASSTKTIVGVTFTFGSSDGTNTITANPGTYTEPSWSGSASSIVFTIGGTSGNRRIASITVTYQGSSSQTKTLSGISTSGQTTTYNVGDTFSYDGTLTATYSDNSTATVTPTSVSSPDMSTSGTKTITLTYTEGGVTKTCTYNITVNEVVSYGETYELATGNNPLIVGDKVIIVAQSSLTATSGFALKDTINSTYYLTPNSVSISSQTISYNSDTMTEWTVGQTNDGYTFYNGSKYLYGYSNTSGTTTYRDLGLSASITTGTSWSVTKNSNSNGYDVVTNSLYLEYYKPSSGSARFTTYSSSNASYPINFYKKAVTAESFAQTFLDNLTCDSTGNNAPTLTMTWSQLNALYSSISSQSEKNLLKNATYTVNNNTVTPGSNTTQVVANAMSKYDIIVGKYSYTDFISRKGTSAYGYASVSINNIFKTNDNIPVIILVISLVSVTSIGGYFFLKRKKFDK